MSRSYTEILNSGMPTILVPLKKTNIVSVGIFIKAGSINETYDNNGIAHFLEHMMFKGTKKRPGNKIAEQLDKIGAHYNAGTSNEYTYYYIYGISSDINIILEILIDLYCNPLLKQHDIDVERQVILEEMDMARDDQNHMLMQTIHNKLFTHSPLGMSVIGEPDKIISYKRNVFVDFRSKHYTPHNSVLVICGNFNKNMILKKVNREFKKSSFEYQIVPHSNIQISMRITQREPYMYMKNIHNINQTLVAWAFRSVSMFHDDTIALDMISDILSSGMSSRLFNTLRNKHGVTYFNRSFHLGYSTEGLFIIMLGVNNKRVFDSIQLVLEELYKLKKKGITKAELDKVKKIKTTSTEVSLQDPKDYLYYYGMNAIFGSNYKKTSEKIDPVSKIYSYIKHVTVRDIHEVINKTFLSNNVNIFVRGDTSTIKNKLNKINVLIRKKLGD
jgi:predicted Zn-dependent peptidase